MKTMLAMKTTDEYRGYVFTVTCEAKDPADIVDSRRNSRYHYQRPSTGESFSNACEAFDLHLESLQKLGQRLPKAKHRVVVEAVESDLRGHPSFSPGPGERS